VEQGRTPQRKKGKETGAEVAFKETPSQDNWVFLKHKGIAREMSSL